MIRAERLEFAAGGGKAMTHDSDMTGTAEPAELGEELLELVAGGAFPKLDPDG